MLIDLDHAGDRLGRARAVSWACVRASGDKLSNQCSVPRLRRFTGCDRSFLRTRSVPRRFSGRDEPFLSFLLPSCLPASFARGRGSRALARCRGNSCGGGEMRNAKALAMISSRCRFCAKPTVVPTFCQGATVDRTFVFSHLLTVSKLAAIDLP